MITKGLKTIFKVLIGVAGLVFLVLLAMGLVILLGWPAWTTVVVLAGFFALGLGGYWLYRLRLRKKEEWFIQELSGGGPTEAPGPQRPDLQAKWKEAVDTLKRSHLRKYGNPLYVLPWYMVIGRSGAGKTTAIRNAQLSSPFATPSPTASPGSTVDCDWWFFDNAVILDMAGRYVVGTEADRGEWKDFLKLLARYRRREPLNGLIAAVSVEDLEGLSERELEGQAAAVRARIDELMNVLGVKFPVYVVVTKCDLVQGMVPLMEQLPEARWKEVLGVSRPLSEDSDARSFVERVMDQVTRRLGELRDIVLGTSPPGKACSFMLLPEEFSRLRGPLAAYLGTLFKETPYQDQPVFRGLYFTSARQEGRPFSRFLAALDIPVKELRGAADRSGFLHDFFARVLVEDRALLAPTTQAISWRRLTQNLGLSIWVLAGLVLCGLLTLSFIKNVGAMRLINREIPVELKLGDDLFQNITELDRYRKAIERLHERNAGWWAPRMGLRQSEALEKRLGDQFVALYKKYVLWPTEDLLGKQVQTLDASTPRLVVANWVDLLARRLKLINARLEGKGMDDLGSMQGPDYGFMLKAALGEKAQQVPDQVSKALEHIDLTYLVFERDREPMVKLSHEETGRLKGLLRREGIGLLWLSDWANLQVETLSPVGFSRYWGGDPGLDETVGPGVPRAYTPEGFRRIREFIGQISSVLDDPGALAVHEDAFYKVYRSRYWEAWGRFLAAFPDGWRLWPDRTGRRELAARMSGDQSPYRRLMRELEDELAPARTKDSREPAWAALVDRYSRIMNNPEYQAVLDTEGKGILKKVMKGGTTVYTWLQKGLRGEEVSQAFKKDQITLRHMRAYNKAIDAFAHQVLTPKGAFETLKKAFEEGYGRLVEPSNPGAGAFYHADRLKHILGKGKEDEAPFWAILYGPPRYVWHFGLSEAGRYAQDVWQQEVVSELQGLSGRDALDAMIGDQGKVWSFVRGDAAPFLQRTKGKGFSPKVLLGGRMPFSRDFVAFLGKARAASRALKGTFQVRLDALPTDANRSARYRPHLTRLALTCNEGTQELLNFNYPVGAVFRWNADTCQEVTLEIRVKDLVLTRRYRGFDAFPRFLREFSKGTRTFVPGDFPSQSQRLAGEYGVKAIRVRYRMRGQGPLLRLLEVGPGQVPGSILAEDPFEATFASSAGDRRKSGADRAR